MAFYVQQHAKILNELVLDQQFFGTSMARVTPGQIHRIPPHEWFFLDPA